MTEAHDYVLEVRALGEQGLQVELYYPELGHAQQELSIRHADGLAAADRMVLYRETVRAVARGRGLWASLAPKPVPDQAGNGAHRPGPRVRVLRPLHPVLAGGLHA